MGPESSSRGEALAQRRRRTCRALCCWCLWVCVSMGHVTVYIEPAHLCQLWSRKNKPSKRVWHKTNKETKLKQPEKARQTPRVAGLFLRGRFCGSPQVAEALTGQAQEAGLGAPQQGHSARTGPPACGQHCPSCVAAGMEHRPTAGHPYAALSTSQHRGCTHHAPPSQPLRQTSVMISTISRTCMRAGTQACQLSPVA